jgi:hypothetical protein
MLFLDPVRHCQICTEISRKEEDFFEKHIKTLQNGTTVYLLSYSLIVEKMKINAYSSFDLFCICVVGGYFMVSDSDMGPDQASLFFLKLSPNHR